MKKLTLARSYLPNKTIGLLFDSEIKLATLENPWLNNKVNDSCIPEGSYIVKRDRTGRFQWYAIQDVEGRTAIEMHTGNLVSHTDGCILIGEAHSDEYDLLGSRSGIANLLDFIGDSDFMLTIRAATKDDM